MFVRVHLLAWCIHWQLLLGWLEPLEVEVGLEPGSVWLQRTDCVMAVCAYSALAVCDGSALAVWYGSVWLQCTGSVWCSALAVRDYSALAVCDNCALAVRDYSALAWEWKALGACLAGMTWEWEATEPNSAARLWFSLHPKHPSSAYTQTDDHALSSVMLAGRGN